MAVELGAHAPAIQRIAMYEQQTTYLLGEGASWHYGYPTGEALLQELAQATEQLFGFLSDCKKLWGPYVTEIVLEGL